MMRGNVLVRILVLVHALVTTEAWTQKPAIGAMKSLTCVLRDFLHPHKDFGNILHPRPGAVKERLNGRGKPVLKAGPWSDTFSNSKNFREWWNPRKSKQSSFKLQLQFDGKNWEHNAPAFFPLGAQNFHFTMECTTRMFYNGEQTSFRFQGDDDIWVFVNNRLLIDRGGCCSAATTEYIGPLNQDKFDLVKGKSYEVKIFFAERRGPGSTFIMSTNFELTTCRGGRWSKWSKCHKRRGIQSRHWETSKRRKPSRRSGVCPKLEKRPCPVDCKVRWKNWGKCDPVRGIRTRPHDIIQKPLNGGKVCPLEKTRPCPVDCKVRWKNWGKCDPVRGIRTRRHDIIQKPLNGGKACPLEKTKDCGYTLHVVWGKQVQTCSHSKNLEILNEHEMVKTVADICSTEFRVPQSNALNEPFNDIFELGASSHVSFVYEDVRSSKTRRVSLTRSYANRSLACPAPSSASSDNYYFKVDNEDAPRVVTLCPSACNLVKNAAAGARRPKGTISFVFEPVVKLAALKVSGRGKRATKLFGPPRKLRPALTFPAKHPALQSLEVCSDPSRGKIRPIIPEYGVAGEDCNRIPGVDLFYDQHRKQTTKGVAHPHTSATPFARDVSDGISMFFFANALGETYFGMQIADEHAGLDDATGDYALVEVMLSGEALSKSRASWVLHDGAKRGSRIPRDPSPKTKGRGQVLLRTTRGKSAGAVLGPLPADDFCIDVMVKEASSTMRRATLVDFSQGTSTRYPSTVTRAVIARDVIDAGGLRFCSNTCDTNANSIDCYTRTNGEQVCAGSELWSRLGGGGDRNYNYNDDSSDDANNEDNNDDGFDDDDEDGSVDNDALGNLKVGVHDSDPKSSDDWPRKQGSGGAAEDEGGKGNLGWWIAGGVSLMAASLLLGAAVYRHRRTATIDNENKKEETAATTPKEEAAGAESSDWDVYVSDEYQRKYWHNRKTGETQWTCPDEVLEADLELGAAEYAMHISASGAPYFSNTSTGDVFWTLPEGATLVQNPLAC